MLDASESAQPFLNAGGLKYQQHDLEGACHDFRQALAIQPDLSPALFNLAVVYRDLERNEEAKSLFDDVLRQGEIEADTHNNLGILAARSEDFGEAESHYRKAIELRASFPLAHFNLANVLLRQESWEEGWLEYEWRWHTPAFTRLNCPQPQWDGQRLSGTLLLHTEQGIGDTIQFARFIPEIRERCDRLIFIRPDHLGCIFEHGQWADDVRSAGEIELDSFDAVLPLMSAPRALQIHTTDQLESQANALAAGYIQFPQRSVNLGPPATAEAKYRVGIAWRGSPTYSNDHFRSTSVDSLAPLLDIPQVAFYSLQIGEAAEELRLSESPINRVQDLSHLQSDLADTAAIVQQLDLIISVDTAILHLGASLGLPTWGLLSRRGDWRWLNRDRLDSPWYPSVELFRQHVVNDWTELIQRVREKLVERFPV